jgi:hypothetical protein
MSGWEVRSKVPEKVMMAAATRIAKDLHGVKGTDKHRALCDQVSKGLADITRKIPEVLGEVRVQETPSSGLVFWDVAIKEDSGFTAAELSEEASNVGLPLLYSSSRNRNTVMFVAPLPEATVADALFMFKKAVLNQKLAALAKAGTWVKKKGEAMDGNGGDEWGSDNDSFGGRDQGGASNGDGIDRSSNGEEASDKWGEDACSSDDGEDDGDFMQAIAASIADLKVGSNLEIEGPNNQVDVSMPMPDVSDEFNQKPSSQEEKDALDRACKLEDEAINAFTSNAGPHGFGEDI